MKMTGNLKKSGEIERLVEAPLVDRAVAKKAERDPVFLAILRGEGDARPQGHVRADDRVTAIHVVGLVEVMHRPAEPARTAGRFAKKLCHAGVRARSASECVGVIAIRRNDVIIRPGGRDRAGHDRFLSDIKMTKAADLLRLILLARALLKAANQQHRREHLDFVALPGRRHWDQCGSGRAAAAGSAASRRLKLMQATKSSVKSRSLTTELRKNIQVGVAPYCGRPTVSAWMRPPKFLT